MRLQGGRSLLPLKGNEERKAITSHFSSAYPPFLLFIALPLLLGLRVSALKLSFVVTLPHLLPGCLPSRPCPRPLAGFAPASHHLYGSASWETWPGFELRFCSHGRRSGWGEEGKKRKRGQGGKKTKRKTRHSSKRQPPR